MTNETFNDCYESGLVLWFLEIVAEAQCPYNNLPGADTERTDEMWTMGIHRKYISCNLIVNLDYYSILIILK